jgi:oxygen-dependent protoporphyrinogen oxidase
MTVPQTDSQRIVVIGGGITGLAAAHRLIELSQKKNRSVEVILLEASERVGGVFGTEQVGDYTIETGADSFITNKPWAVDLVNRLGMQDELISPNPEFQRSLILHRGKTFVTPVGFNLLAPSKVCPMLTTPLLSPLGKLRMIAEYFIPRKQDDVDESLAAFVRRRFGQEMLDRIVQPMVGGIYTSDPEQLSLKATLPRFVELEKQYGSLIKGLRRTASREKQDANASGARYGLFATPRGGMSDLLNKLQALIQENAIIRLNCKVTSVTVESSGCTLEVNGTESLRADGVVLALPSYHSGKLLSPLDEELGESLSQINYASSAIMVSGHRLEDIDHPLDAFGLVIPHIEGRRILAVSFLSRKFPGRAPEGHVILRTFVGGAMQPEEINCPDEQVIETVLSELRELLGVRGEPDFVRLVRYNRAMPQYTVGHLDRIARIRELASAFPNLGLAGNGFEGVGVPDCIHSGEEAAKSVWDSTTTGSANHPL